MPRTRVLITDAETRAVVAACRGLAGAGYRVTAVAGSRPAPAHWSRACHERLLLPSALEDPAGFGRRLEGALAAGDVDLVIPGSDASLLALSAQRHLVEPQATLALPTHEAVLAGLDKRALAEAAAAEGLTPPETVVCSGREEVAAAAVRLGYPLLLKPVSSVVVTGAGGWRSGSVRIEDADGLAAQLAAYGDPCLLQRCEPGEIVSFAGVLADGRLLGMAMSRYARTWHPTAGNVCCSRTVSPPRELAERVAGLLGRLGWQGIFELELVARPDGSHAAIDLNPRVYGSLALAIRAGANLPALWAEWALGGDPRPVSAAPGVHYRWEDADMRHLLWQLRRGRVGAAAAVLRPRLRAAHAYFAAADPGPLAGRVGEVAKLARARSRRSAHDEVVIVGAGPYGLAAAAHLRHAGVPVRVFGEPLEFWRTQMPEGMILRSRRRSSNISDPERELGIEDYEADSGRRLRSPSLKLEEFIDYGLWFQRRVAPDLDTRRLRRLERADRGFRIELEDGADRTAARVVVAAGLFPFGRRPTPFEGLPSSLVSHTSEHRDLARFAGREVLVVGAGQSALESAALLHEAGARVEVAARGADIYWLADDPSQPRPRKSLRSRLPLPPTDVGGFGTGWTAALPDLFRRIPGGLKPVVSYRCIRPAGSGWLRPRLEQVRIRVAAPPVAAAADNGGVRVEFGDGSERTVEHVLLGTGYEIDVRRYPFLAPDLSEAVEVVDGYPLLGRGLESSLPGLHFLGAPAARSFGPIMGFVVGTWYAAPALTAQVLGRRQPPLRRAF